MKDREIGKALMILQNHIIRTMDKMHNEKMVPKGQGRVLRYIYNHKEHDIFQKDIEEEFNLRRSSATEILQKLESFGAIQRDFVEKDKRIKKICITQKGEESVHQVDLNICKMESILKNELTDEEVENFFKVIDKMTLNCKGNEKEEKQ